MRTGSSCTVRRKAPKKSIGVGEMGDKLNRCAVHTQLNMSGLTNNETSIIIRQPLTLFPSFVQAHEQFFHFNPDKHQGTETEANQ